MTAIRTLVIGIVAWGAGAASATAAPLSWFGSQDELTAWYANHLHNSGNIYAPSSSNTLSNFSLYWIKDSSSSASSSSSKGVPASSVAAVEASSGPKQEQQLFQAEADPPAERDAPAQVKRFVNFGSKPYAEASSLTVGAASPWYQSEAVTKVFDGSVPNESQRTDFVQSVLANVEHTFRISGLDLKLSDDSDSSNSRMISVVSGLSYKDDKENNVAGITYVGSSGFSFIDKLAGAKSPEELAWVLAHNVAHELMHSLGVADHPDETGEYLDAGRASWDMMTNPDTKFSPEAIAIMKSATTSGVNVGALGLQLIAEAQQVAAESGFMADSSMMAPVPEPSTVAIWTLSGLFAGFSIRRRYAPRGAA